ncbi:MAG: GntR family transcriptional regulator [Pirellulales bacterium]|nr:GntR family transcriptional regulator [Pirellulales bacterium]
MSQPLHGDKANTDSGERGSLANLVYEHVSKLILSGELVSGDIIDRKRVAEDLNVSLAPVGEAVIRLVNEGFLEASARRHTMVRVVRKGDVRGQFVLRLALERQAVSMTHGEPVRRAKLELLKLAEEVDRFPPKHPSAWSAEIAFHRLLVDLAECPALSNSHEQVMRRNYFFSINSAHVTIRKKEYSLAQHSKLVEGLCTDNAAEADRVILDHYAEDWEAMLRPGSEDAL